MGILELTNSIVEAKTFSLYLKNAAEMSRNTRNILNILPHKICNFTFFRLNKNGEFNMVTPNPLRGYKYAHKGFWRSDVTMNFNYGAPIYDRRDYLAEALIPSYDRFLLEIGGKSCIAISYKFGDFKDTLVFVFSEVIEKAAYASLYPMLHNVASSFYHLEIQFKTTFKLPREFEKEYQYHDFVCEFNSFESLIETYNLTKSEVKYLPMLALHIPLDYIAVLLYKSRRTIEKNIDEIRAKLGVNSKFELCQLLQAYHISKVQQGWLKAQ